jgi:hypothetical protein
MVTPIRRAVTESGPCLHIRQSVDVTSGMVGQHYHQTTRDRRRSTPIGREGGWCGRGAGRRGQASMLGVNWLRTSRDDNPVGRDREAVVPPPRHSLALRARQTASSSRLSPGHDAVGAPDLLDDQRGGGTTASRSRPTTRRSWRLGEPMHTMRFCPGRC